MQLRILSIRIIRCFPRPLPLVTGQRCFERCLYTVQHNLKPVTSNLAAVHHQQYRFKRTGVKKVRSVQDESDSQDDDDDDNEEKNSGTQESSDKVFEVEPGAKIITYKLDNPRVDKLLRKALNISRKNVEDLFYNKKIQLNNELLTKKSHQVVEGDLISVALQETSGKTARGALIEVLEVIEHENNCSVRVSRNKNTYVNV